MITDLQKLKDNLIHIYNRNNFLIQVPQIHPDLPKYNQVWTEYTRKCIEGHWAYDVHGWRFMPATLFFYGNFYKILKTNLETKSRYYGRPDVRDIDWMIHYAFLVAKGFSGFEKDNKYTCDERVLTYDKKKLPKGSEINLFDSKGNLKQYVKPYDYLRKLHDSELGRPMYNNNAKNIMLFGSRGGGKSYTVSGILAHHVTFDGLVRFDSDPLNPEAPCWNNPSTAVMCIGASETDKSSELFSKVLDGLYAFGLDKSLGVWGDVNSDDYTPNPFYRDYIGSKETGNKQNYFRYEFEAEINGRWQKGQGTKSGIIHVNYSDKKQGGAQAAAGGRYLISIYEEVGLMPNFTEALFSNVATVSDEGVQFGVQIGLGTSGNIDLVQQSKKVFTSPTDYNFVSFNDIWEDSGEIGLFIPAYIVNTDFKDENGNTILEIALDHYYKRREDAARSKDPENLRNEKMNYPLVPSDMWISSKGSYFPIMEALERERELLKDRFYQKIGRPVNLIWDSKQPYGVRAEYNPQGQPFYEFPYDRSMTSIEGCFMIYEEPSFINGEIPEDMFIFTLDPYVAENIEDGESLGVFFGFLNPKYTKEGYNGNYLVCSYIGKHPNGKNAFYEVIEKALAYYGNPPRMLWYEANRGDSVRDYFIRRNKTKLLALRPTRSKGSSAVEKRVIDYGFLVSGKVDKLEMITDTYEWLLSETSHNGEKKRVIETFPCIFTLRQMINFTLEKSENYDAISALIGYPMALKELEHQNLKEEKKKIKHNPISFLSMNPYIFKDSEDRLRKLKYETYKQDSNK